MIKQFTLNPPAHKQSGDVFERDGNYLNQIRNGAVVRTWNLRAMQSQRLEGFATSGELIETLFLEQGMPGQNVALTRVDIGTQGQVSFVFGDGNAIEYSNWDSIAGIAEQLDSTESLAQQIVIAKSYRRDPAGVNKANFVGGQVSVNLDADQPVVVTPPVE